MLYMASVQHKGKHLCGGFIVSDEFVVTAAHCGNKDSLTVVLGTHNLKKVNDRTMRYNITKCIHKDYEGVKHGNDIMLLKLSKKAQLNSRVQPIQLPRAQITLKDKAKCSVAGWGRTKSGGKVSEVLKAAVVSVVDLNECRKLGDTMNRLGKYLILHVLTCVGHLAHGTDIINGKKAPVNSLLYMASVQNNDGHVCGGFLISEEWVVTAAHCDDSSITHVIVGSHNLKGENNRKIKIENKCKHESYKSVGLGYDIMLLKLSSKATISNNIGIIQVPVSNIKLEEDQVCFVAGWGATRTKGLSVDELRVVNVSVVSPQVCKSEWLNLPLNVICAGGSTTKGFCQGDSGGPLVCGDQAVGIVSFNRQENCNYPEKPNVYTDISKYNVWIFNVVKNNC
ncbi:mast cell protease 1A-like [Xenentodon cancila]